MVADGLSASAELSCGIEIEWHPSGNFGKRRGTSRPELIVLHYTAMESTEAALERLCSPKFEVSTHYLIGEDGRTYQLVEDVMRAWHAGVGTWLGKPDVNSRSLGIELANDGTCPYPESQMATLELLLRKLLERWGIPSSGVIGHSDFALGRKGDPGPRFDWRRLALQGLSVWPTEVRPCKPDKEKFEFAARSVGYPVPSKGAEQDGFERLLRAFRLRFRPWAASPDLDEWDMAAVLSIARQFQEMK